MELGIGVIEHPHNKVHLLDNQGRALCGRVQGGKLFGDEWFSSIGKAKAALYEMGEHGCKWCCSKTITELTVAISAVKRLFSTSERPMNDEDIGIGLMVLNEDHPGYLNDVMAFISGPASVSDKRFNIMHDIYGKKSRKPHFLPRLTGYAERAK